MTSEGERSTSGLRRLGSRKILGPDGTAWLVQEVEDSRYSRRSTRSLVFSSDAAMRRVRSYPPTWMDLSDAQLFDLSFAI